MDYGEIYRLLRDDLSALNTLWDSKQNKMGRRVFAVFVFSTFESIGWVLLNYVNKSIPTSGKGAIQDGQLTAAESKENQKINPVEHINFALRYAASFHGIRDFAPSKVPLWKCVVLANKVRDRVVHPRTLESLTVTGEEHTSCKCALAWLLNCLTVLEFLGKNPGKTFREALRQLTA